MLIWWSQKQELARVVTGSRREAERLISGYYRRQPDAIEELGQLRYEAEGSTLIEIIEMLQPDEWLFGEPDYLVAEWLQQHSKPSSGALHQMSTITHRRPANARHIGVSRE